MPWFRLDDTFHSHPKVIAAGNEAVGLYTRCGSYAAQHLTDGFIPEHVALLYGSAELADTLVRTRLWRRARGGWVMPDYLQFNPSHDAVDKDRQQKAERQKRWREARGRRVTNASSNAGVEPAPPRPAPKEAGRGRPDPTPYARGRASPTGATAANGKAPWCGTCDQRTRQLDNGDSAQRCPRCHPLAVGLEAESWRATHQEVYGR